MDRRQFVTLAGSSTLAWQFSTDRAEAAQNMTRFGMRAVAFDGFPIFDPRPIAAVAESLYPGRGPAIMSAWRGRQFDYQWLRALSGHYADFLEATEASLLFASKQLQLDLTVDNRRQLMSAWSQLPVWPDVPDAVRALRKAGLRLTFLSNMTATMLRDGLKRAGLENTFDAVLSTDQIRTYKPDPAAYQMAMDELQLRREEILFVAFAGWDVAGAKWFGYPTFWVNRLGSPMEELGVAADASGAGLDSLVRYVAENRAD